MMADGLVNEQLIRRKRPSDDRLDNYIFEASRRLEPGLELERSVFQCTYKECNKIINGGTAMVCHLWAHINITSTFKSLTSPLSMLDAVRGVHISTRCPECLQGFQCQYDVQLHFKDAHSRITGNRGEEMCAICEETQPDLLEHLGTHPAGDSPYICRGHGCDFRTSSRMQLFDHYAQIHRDTNMLWCPFCPFVIFLPRKHIRLRNEVKIDCSALVDHFVEHLKVEQAHRCPRCAYTFLTRSQLSAHLSAAHTGIKLSTWTITMIKNQTLNLPAKPSKPCDGNNNDDCPICDRPCPYKQYEKTPSTRRIIAAPKILRGGLNKQRIGRIRYKCSCGGFMTFDPDRFAVHAKSCFSSGGVFLESLPERALISAPPSKDELQEAAFFALVPSKKPAPFSSAPFKNRITSFPRIAKICNLSDDTLPETKRDLIRVRDNDVAASLAVYRQLFA